MNYSSSFTLSEDDSLDIVDNIIPVATIYHQAETTETRSSLTDSNASDVSNLNPITMKRSFDESTTTCSAPSRFYLRCFLDGDCQGDYGWFIDIESDFKGSKRKGKHQGSESGSKRKRKHEDNLSGFGSTNRSFSNSCSCLTHDLSQEQKKLDREVEWALAADIVDDVLSN